MTMLTEGQQLESRRVSNPHREYPSPDVTTAADAMLSLRNSTPQSRKMNVQYSHQTVPPPASQPGGDIYVDMQDNLSRQNSNSGSEHSQSAGHQRKEREFIPDSKKDHCYWIKRHKNNQAAKRSREKRRMNDAAMGQRILELTNENTKIRQELEALKRRFGIPIDQPITSEDQSLDSSTHLTQSTVDGVSTIHLHDSNSSSDLQSTSNNHQHQQHHVGLKTMCPTQTTHVPQSQPPPPPQHVAIANSSAYGSRGNAPQMPAQLYTSNNNNNNNYTSSAQSSVPPALIPLNTVSSASYISNIINSGQANNVPVNNNNNNNNGSSIQNQINSHYSGSMTIAMSNQEMNTPDLVVCSSSAPNMVAMATQSHYHMDGQQQSPPPPPPPPPQQNGYYPEESRHRSVPNNHYSDENAYVMQQANHFQEERRVVNCYHDNNNYDYNPPSGENSRKNSLDSICESPRRLQICYSSASESNVAEQIDITDSPLNLTKRKRKSSSVGTYDSSDSEPDDDPKRRNSSYVAYSTNTNMPLKFRHKVNSTEHVPPECFTLQEQESINNGSFRRQSSASQCSVFSDDSNGLDDKYLDRRRRNNVAAKKCRENRRSLHELRIAKSSVLENENSQLREELQSLTHEVSQLKDLVKKKRDNQLNIASFK